MRGMASTASTASEGDDAADKHSVTGSAPGADHPAFNPRYQCHGKVAYRSRAAARAAARSVGSRNGRKPGRIEQYACPHCSTADNTLWHNGRAWAAQSA
jgi:hypothetical protein